jgi:hypothetical protein
MKHTFRDQHGLHIIPLTIVEGVNELAMHTLRIEIRRCNIGAEGKKEGGSGHAISDHRKLQLFP